MMKNRYLMSVVVILSCLSVVGNADNKQPQTDRQVLQPKMRVVDRDWHYFKSITCEKIAQTVFHSRSEEILVTKRKTQCLDKYKAFLPKPVNQ